MSLPKADDCPKPSVKVLLSHSMTSASFRNFSQISEVLLAGADILTVPAGILTRVADHPLTQAGMLSFDSDAKTFAE